MTNLKNIGLAIILTNFLSCKSPRLNLVTKQCAFVSYETGCACRDFEFSREYLGVVKNSVPAPIEVCKQMIGYPNYNEVSSFYEKVWRAIRDDKADNKLQK